jgi:L-amino acid N-acyltransferase YncA
VSGARPSSQLKRGPVGSRARTASLLATCPAWPEPKHRSARGCHDRAVEQLPISAAAVSDVAAITAIYNRVIETSTAVFRDRPVSEDDQLAWLEARRADGFPVLVVRDAGEAVAFATYGAFRPWPGYRTTVEHSVHVAETHRRQGLGRRLVEALVEHAGHAGLHVMVAGVDADNAASLALHEALGFRRVAHLSEIARKFDRWIDLVLLQRTLGTGSPHAEGDAR